MTRTLIAALVALLLGIAGAAALELLQLRVIQSESMRPTLAPGDLYVGVSARLVPPEVGDVVAFTARRLDGTATASFVHRVVAEDRDGGLITQGDANPDPDIGTVARRDVHSVAVVLLPYGGLLVTLRPVLLVLASTALAMALLPRRGVR